jgi:outer membrane protein TolC
MRWTIGLSTLALLMALAAGCKQQCFLLECDKDHYVKNLAGFLEFDPDASQRPASVVHTNGGTPSTVLDPDRKIRYLSLAEAISISLEQGTVGRITGTGQGIDDLISINGFNLGGTSPLTSDQIRVLALNPAQTALAIDGALSKFDAFFTSSMIWNTTDRPIGTALDAFQAGRTGALNAIQTDAATFTSSLLKPLPTGGTAGITFNTQYQFTNLPARVNPSYTPSLTFAFEQPLLQGFGTEINQLRTLHPGSQLLTQTLPGASFAGQAFGGSRVATDGILLTRIRFDQERANFEANVGQMVLNVEVAYWNLYGAYWTLYSRELGLRLAYEFYRIVNARYIAGGVSGVPGGESTRLQDVARARGQYELFREQRLEALGRVLEAERQLRKFLGMPAVDCDRLVPSDTPTVAPYQPDWCSSLQEAINLRPELIISRENIKRAQLVLIQTKNDIMPDLRFFATYDVNSIGSRLDGPGADNAFRNLADNKFNNYAFGFRLNVPIGYRDAYAALRRARLEVARSYAVMKDQEIKAEQFLTLQYRNLFEFHERIKAQRAQREAYALQLRLEFERVKAGERTIARDTAILEAQRFFSDALSAEYGAITEYNNSLARFEYAKGTMLHHNNISIADGPLPNCAAEQAAEHHRKRNVALLVAERSHPLHCADCNDSLNLPHLPEYSAGSLPALQANAPAVPDGRTPEELPKPKSLGENGTQLLDQPLPPNGTTPAGPAASPGAPPAGASRTDLTPPARPEPFGAARMPQPSVTSRDSAPSLQPPQPPSPIGQ